MDRALELLVADVGLALGSKGNIIGVASDGMPRFVLFHAANSICSQKVRCVLAHHRIPYMSHEVNLFAGQTYLPAYVRLRMIGCTSFGGALVSSHSGSTSASAGCDGVVVPTLVDREVGEVIVDSKQICIYLDQQFADGKRLRQEHLATAIDRELAIVDELPNYQMLMGSKAGAEEDVVSATATRAAFSQRKVAWCETYIAECAGETALVDAYSAKRSKELSAVTDLFSAEAMEIAKALVESALEGLENKLERRSQDWLFGDQPTMADLFWGIQLLRLNNLKLSSFWDESKLRGVGKFAQATQDLPSVRSAIVDWPGAMG
jgi:2,5-dichlorohydroquinone reductive dechlorinase